MTAGRSPKPLAQPPATAFAALLNPPPQHPGPPRTSLATPRGPPRHKQRLGRLTEGPGFSHSVIPDLCTVAVWLSAGASPVPQGPSSAGGGGGWTENRAVGFVALGQLPINGGWQPTSGRWQLTNGGWWLTNSGWCGPDGGWRGNPAAHKMPMGRGADPPPTSSRGSQA